MDNIVTDLISNDDNAHLYSDTKLLPNSETFLKVKTQAKTDKPIMFEAIRSEKMIKRGVVFARSIGCIDTNNCITVCAINASKEPVSLRSDELVGHISDFVLLDDIQDRELSINTSDIQETELKSRIDSLSYGKDLSVSEQTRIKQVILNKSKAFKWHDGDRGMTNMCEHVIDTGNHPPIKQTQYRIPPSIRTEVDKQINEMLSNNVIEPSVSSYCNPILMVAKKSSTGKKYRFCIDFRKLNEITVKEAHPLPRIDDTLDALGNAKYFTSLDLDSAFWQIPLEVKSREKTAFVAGNKLYQFKVMPFGLANAPGSFQRLMEVILNGLTWHHCLVYLDDVIIFSNNFDTHLCMLNEVLDRFINANLKLQPVKCQFGMDELNYLGFKISKFGVSPNPHKVEALVHLNTPKTRSEVERFVGSISYYRRHIFQFSNISAPLYKLTRANQKFRWSKECDMAFETLKKKLHEAPILAFPNFSLLFEIFSDASDFAIGCCLVQETNNMYSLIACFSRQLSDTERRYSAS